MNKGKMFKSSYTETGPERPKIRANALSSCYGLPPLRSNILRLSRRLNQYIKR